MQKILEDLSAVIGTAHSFEIVRRWSGRDLYVPEKMTPDHPLALTVGLDAAMKLSASFPGCHLRIPMEKHALRSMREAAIYHDKEVLGKSFSAIADKWGLTRSAAKAIVIKMRKANQAPTG